MGGGSDEVEDDAACVVLVAAAAVVHGMHARSPAQGIVGGVVLPPLTQWI